MKFIHDEEIINSQLQKYCYYFHYRCLYVIHMNISIFIFCHRGDSLDINVFTFKYASIRICKHIVMKTFQSTSLFEYFLFGIK
jgi:hypothetical protein